MDHQEDAMDLDFFAPNIPNPLAEEAHAIERETRKRLFGDIDLGTAWAHPPQSAAPAVQLGAPSQTQAGRKNLFKTPLSFFKRPSRVQHATPVGNPQLLSEIRQQYPTIFHLYLVHGAQELTREKLRWAANQDLQAAGLNMVSFFDTTDERTPQKRARTGTNHIAPIQSIISGFKFAVAAASSWQGHPQFIFSDRGLCPGALHARSIHELYELEKVVVSDKFPAPIGSTVKLPLILDELVGALLQDHVVGADGIFRNAGPENESIIAQWVESIGDRPWTKELARNVNPHDLSTLLKRWLASAPCDHDRLFPMAHSRAIEQIVSTSQDPSATKRALRAVIQCLDVEHASVLAAVTLVARAVMTKGTSRMDAENLARMFAPNVFAFHGVMDVAAVKWAAKALVLVFSEPDLAYWFTPISHDPFVMQPYISLVSV